MADIGQLPDGWHSPDAETAARLHKELQTELPPEHPLYGLALEVVACHDRNDDIVCRHRRDSERYTVVHLTWIGRQEVVDSRFPVVQTDGDFAAFLEYARGFLITTA